MSDYTLQATWSTKDALATGTTLKAVSATELGTEFDAIAAAILTKYDSTNIASTAEAKALLLDTVLITPSGLSDVLGNNAAILTDLNALTVAGFSAADALLAWDDSAGAAVGMTLSTGLTFSGTVLTLDSVLQDILALAVTDGNIIVGDGANFVAENGATARTSLGVAIGTNVQAWDADLDAIAAMAKTADNFIIGDGAAWQLVIPANARTALGVGTGDSPQLTAVNIGHASDCTLSRDGAGQIAIAGDAIFSHESSTYTSSKIHFSTSAPTTEGTAGDIYYEYTA